MSTPTNGTSTTTKIDGRTREGRALRNQTGEQARQTAHTATEAARETAHEVVEETTSFLGRVGGGIASGLASVGHEVNSIRKAAQPHAKTIVYTAVTVTDPIMGLGLMMTNEGIGLMRRRAQENAVAKAQVTVTTEQTEEV